MCYTVPTRYTLDDPKQLARELERERNSAKRTARKRFNGSLSAYYAARERSDIGQLFARTYDRRPLPA